MEAKRCLLEDQISTVNKEKNNYESILVERDREILELKEGLAKNLIALDKKSNNV